MKPSFEPLTDDAIIEHTMRPEDVFDMYKTNPTKGLSTVQVAPTRTVFGWNLLNPPKRRAAKCLNFLKITFDGFSLLIWCGSLLCFIAYGIQIADTNRMPPEDNFYLGVVLAVVAFITSCFTYYQMTKSAAVMSSFRKMLPQAAEVIRDGHILQLLAIDLLPGDLIRLKEGDKVPADVLIVECNNLRVDESSLTGESLPVIKSSNCTSENPRETANLAFCSTNVVKGECTGLVLRIGDKTFVGHIAELTTITRAAETPIRREIRHFMRLISWFAVTVGVLFGVLALTSGYTVIEAVIFLIGIIVGNVPLGLLATVTVILALTAKKMARKNCLVKNVEAVETLGSTSVICSDKTGTLTQNKMTVTYAWFNFQLVKINMTEGEYGKGFDSNLPGWKELNFAASLCLNAKFKEGEEDLPVVKRAVRGDPTESAILKMCTIVEGTVEELQVANPRVGAIPFSSMHMYQVSINQTSTGNFHLTMKGAPEVIVKLCKSYLKNGEDLPIDATFMQEFNETCERIGAEGCRLMGFSDHVLPARQFPPNFVFDTEDFNFPVSENRYLGLLALMDPPKANVPEAVALCKKAGIRVMMVTGDHPASAVSIARDIGIISKGKQVLQQRAIQEDNQTNMTNQDMARVIVGSDLCHMSDQELEEELKTFEEIVFARTTPSQKLRIVEANQKLGAVVAVTGDGVNDSIALKKANIGIAMGIQGSDVSKDAADMVLLDDNFASIVGAIEEGRLIYDNLKKSIAYTLTSNIPEITPFLAFIFSGIPMPLGPVAILCLDLGTDVLPAISLAYEDPEKDIMSRSPRDPIQDRLVNKTLIYTTFCLVGVMQATAGFFQYFVIMSEHGFRTYMLHMLRKEWESDEVQDLRDSYKQEWSYPQRKQLEYLSNTGFFLAIVQVQWVNLMIVKTQKKSILEHGLCSNRLGTFALLFETALAICLIYIPGTETAFRLYALSPTYWLPPLPFVILIFLFDEGRKYYIRKSPQGRLAKLTMY